MTIISIATLARQTQFALVKEVTMISILFRLALATVIVLYVISEALWITRSIAMIKHHQRVVEAQIQCASDPQCTAL